MKRVNFLIDGFNLYHSILQIKRDTGYCTKWLDISSLCKSYLHLFGKDARLQSIYYFTAIPYYLSNRNPKKITRHENYITCLESSGIIKELGRFKEKTVFCDKCKSLIIKQEEKETDVSIGIRVFTIFYKDECDIAVIMSGDTDLSPALNECKSLFPEKKIIFAFPYKRKNKELAKLAPESFSINKKLCIKHQFPNPVILENGEKIFKPETW